MTEEQLRKRVDKYMCNAVPGVNTLTGNLDGIMSLFTHQLDIKDAEHAKALELAKIEQNKFSRGDEFLWFVRKLREFMGDSTSSRYKAFESNFISQYEHKYLEYFKVISELTKQKDLLTKESK